MVRDAGSMFQSGFSQGYSASSRKAESRRSAKARAAERAEDRALKLEDRAYNEEQDVVEGMRKAGVYHHLDRAMWDNMELEEKKDYGSNLISKAVAKDSIVDAVKADKAAWEMFEATGRFPDGYDPGSAVRDMGERITEYGKLDTALNDQKKHTTNMGIAKSTNPYKAREEAAAQEELNMKAQAEVDKSLQKKMQDDVYKTDRLAPKVDYLNEVGARSVKETMDVMANMGLPIKPGRGANALLFNVASSILDRAHLTSLRDSVGKMKLEIGTELMRTLGAFRNPSFAKEFGATLGEFTGDPYRDVDNLATSVTKFMVNKLPVDEGTKHLSADEQLDLTKKAEVMSYYRLSKAWVDMGVMPEFYWGRIEPQTVVERLGDFITDHEHYAAAEEAARRNNPNISDEDIKLEFFMRGSKEGWL